MVFVARKVFSFAGVPAPSGYSNGLNVALSSSKYVNQIGTKCPVGARESTKFIGQKVRSPRVRLSSASTSVTKMALDPWSVSPEFLDVLAAQSFAASLFPYLGFLYFLSKEETNCPKVANFGFRFLLVFVGATIPAGIWAKIHYNDILANIDWLHGSAESLLTITNLLIVVGFRKAVMPAITEKGTSFARYSIPVASNWTRAFLGVASLALFAATPLLFSGTHPEPSNALSFPTWVIHISSLFEWLAAMGLVWSYADLTGNSRWRGLTWGMLPLHTSGLCACTYHLFYNAPSLNILVAIQALLTVFGNSTMWWATYRIYQSGSVREGGDLIPGTIQNAAMSIESGTEDVVDSKLDPEPVFLLKLLVASALASALVKWGELYFDAPFNPTLAVALAFILVPTTLNIVKWAIRSDARLSSLSKFF